MQHLSHPATVPRRIDMHQAFPLDSASELPQQFHGSLWSDVSIIFKHPGHLIDVTAESQSALPCQLLIAETKDFVSHALQAKPEAPHLLDVACQFMQTQAFL